MESLFWYGFFAGAVAGMVFALIIGLRIAGNAAGAAIGYSWKRLRLELDHDELMSEVAEIARGENRP